MLLNTNDDTLNRDLSHELAFHARPQLEGKRWLDELHSNLLKQHHFTSLVSFRAFRPNFMTADT